MSGKTKERSPAFPFINLARGIERARQFYSEEKRGAAPFARAVLHWQYSESSSGAQQTVAALKSYGLLREVGGSGKARQLQLTDLALRILLDQRPDSSEKEAYVRQAALRPAVAVDVYRKWPILPSEPTLLHYLIVERRFTEGAAHAVSRILKENQEFARVTGADIGAASGDTDPEVEAPEERLSQVSDAVGEHAISAAAVRDVTSAGASAAGVRDVVTVPYVERLMHTDGVTQITLSFSATATSEMYRCLEQFAGFKAAVLEAAEARKLA
jgi:hypothetical protein